MRAHILLQPGEIRLDEVARPRSDPDSVVVKIRAALTCGTDLKAFNTFESPNKVVMTKLDAAKAGAKMTLKLPARSYSVFHLAV